MKEGEGPPEHGGVGVVRHGDLLPHARQHRPRVQHLPLECPPLAQRSRL